MDELTLQGDRVFLRPLAEEDLPRLLAILQEPGVSEWWACYDMNRLRADTLEYEGSVPLAIELEGQLIGIIMFVEENDPFYRYASIDVSIAAHLLGQGLGTDAIRTLARYLFEERGHHRLTIDPAVANARAIAAYKKVGFKPVGVMRDYEKGADGNWHDNLLMDMLTGELLP